MKRQFDAACRQYGVKTARGEGIAEWQDGVKSSLPSVKLLGKTMQGEAPSPEAPQEVKANNATVRSFGKNLFIRLPEETKNGVTLTHLADGGYLLDGACTESGNFQTTMQLPAGQYTLSCAYEGVLPGDDIERVMVYDLEHGIAASIWSRHAASVCRFTVSAACAPFFRIHMEMGHTYDHVKLYPLLVTGAFTTVTMPGFTPYLDGGEATAPQLMCASDGSCQSAYDPQTGEFVNWWWDKVTLNGSEEWKPVTEANDGKTGFVVAGMIPQKMVRNPCWSNQTAPQAKLQTHNGQPELWCGFGDTRLYAFSFGFYDETLVDKGTANWKAHLARHPLEVWVARNEPEVTNIGPQRLTCPTGYGQIMQVAGDAPACPMEVRYLTHGGNTG